MKYTISREYWFSASHLIQGHPKCGRLHGHNYKVVVYLENVLDEQGMVLDFGKVDVVVKPIIDDLDHYTLFSKSNIESEPELFELCKRKDWAVALPIKHTTAEMLSWYIYTRVCGELRMSPNKVRVLVQETPRSDALYES